MVTLSDINKAFNLGPDNIKQVTANYGKVISINPDKTYQVSLNGSDTTVKCARLTGAKVNDVVLVVTLKNGYSVVTGCVGGDTDAADAQATADSTAQYFWTDTDGAHVTETPKDNFISTPSGGNILLHSNTIKIRRALAVLAELDADGMTVYSGSGTQLAKFGSRIVLGSPTAAHLEILNNGITGCEISQFRRNAQGDIVAAPNSILMGYNGDIQIASTNGTPHNTLTISSGAQGFKYNGYTPFTTFTATGTISINGGTGGNVIVTGTVPTGYTPIAVQGITSDHNYTCLIGKFTLTATGADISIRNVSNTNYSNMTVTATILCTSLQ